MHAIPDKSGKTIVNLKGREGIREKREGREGREEGEGGRTKGRRYEVRDEEMQCERERERERERGDRELPTRMYLPG